MLFRITLTVFLVFGGSKIASTDVPPAPTQPQVLIKGKPPKFDLVALVSENSRNITYQAHYCHPSPKTSYCIGRNHEYYKTVCTFNETNRVRATLLHCNMSGVIWSLYPNLLNSSVKVKAKGNTLCVAISATHKNETRYSKKKCRSVRMNNICSGILNLQVIASAKRELNITWETPSDVSDEWNKVLVYEVRYTGNNETKTITYTPFTEKLRNPSRQHSVILKNLPPYTPYSVGVSCYYVSPSGNFDSQTYARTLPEAPNVPPTITDMQTVASNETMKSVYLGWRHPPKSKRNGVILKSVVSVWIKGSISSSFRTLAVNPFNLTVHGNANGTVIKGLDINQDYLVAVMSCTVECSEQSAEYEIRGKSKGPLPSPQASTGGPLSSVVVTILVPVLILFLAILSVVIGYVLYQRRKKRRDQMPSVPLPEPNDVQVSDSDDTDQLESSDYARPEPLLTSVETNHEQASILQSENDGVNSEKRIPSMEEIPLCQNH